MADLALVTTNQLNVVESIIQDTQPAAEAITAGQIVQHNTTGRFARAVTNAGVGAMYGVATRTVAAGEAVTAIRKGVVEGHNLDALAYAAPVYSSATVGAISDTLGTGTMAGRVIPVRSNRASATADKALFIDL